DTDDVQAYGRSGRVAEPGVEAGELVGGEQGDVQVPADAELDREVLGHGLGDQYLVDGVVTGCPAPEQHRLQQVRGVARPGDEREVVEAADVVDLADPRAGRPGRVHTGQGHDPLGYAGAVARDRDGRVVPVGRGDQARIGAVGAAGDRGRGDHRTAHQA